MKTLLEKVAAIEAEAKNIVDTARQTSNKVLAELTQSENDRLLKIREKSAATGKKIAGKSLQEAQKDLIDLHTKHKKKIIQLKQTAQENRRQAALLAIKLFQDFL